MFLQFPPGKLAAPPAVPRPAKGGPVCGGQAQPEQSQSPHLHAGLREDDFETAAALFVGK